jgi:hypothetical protein
MKKEDREQRARDELVAHHKNKLVKLFGTNFETNPRFHQVIYEVAHNARTPALVLADYTSSLA